MLWAMRPPHPREFAAREERDARRADRGGEMLHARVVANQHRAARQHLARFANGGLAGEARGVAADRTCDSLAHRRLGRATEHDYLAAARSEVLSNLDKPLDRPSIRLQFRAGCECDHE